MGIIDGSTAVLTSKNLYSFVKSVKTPTSADLREPVTFYRENKRPTKGPDGLYDLGADDEVTPYHNAWAFVWQSQIATLDGQNVQDVLSHVFIVRNFPGFAPETRDGIVWKGRMHGIVGTRNLQDDRRQAFLLIIANAEGLYKDEPRVNLNDIDPSVEYPDDPLWL